MENLQEYEALIALLKASPNSYGQLKYDATSSHLTAAVVTVPAQAADSAKKVPPAPKSTLM